MGFLWFWLWLGAQVAVAGDPAPTENAPQAEDVDPTSSIEDPRRLNQLAKEALDAGDVERARALFMQRLERMEIRKYLKYRDDLRDALVLEMLGQLDEAEVRHRRRDEA